MEGKEAGELIRLDRDGIGELVGVGADGPAMNTVNGKAKKGGGLTGP